MYASATNGAVRLYVRARKRTPKGKWIKVNVYRADDPALLTGARTYKRTAPFVADAYTAAA